MVKKQEWKEPEWWSKLPEDLRETVKENMMFHSAFTQGSQELAAEKLAMETEKQNLNTKLEKYAAANDNWVASWQERVYPRLKKKGYTDEQIQALWSAEDEGTPGFNLDNGNDGGGNEEVKALLNRFDKLSTELENLKSNQTNQSQQFLNILKTTRELDKVVSALPEQLRSDDTINRIMDNYGKPLDIPAAQFLTLKDHYLDEAKKAGIAEGLKQAAANQEALLTGEGGTIPGKSGVYHFSNKSLEDATEKLIDQIKEK